MKLILTSFLRNNWVGLVIAILACLFGFLCKGLTSIGFFLIFFIFMFFEVLFFEYELEKNEKGLNAVKKTLQSLGLVGLIISPVVSCFYFNLFEDDPTSLHKIGQLIIICVCFISFLITLFYSFRKSNYFKLILILRYLITLSTIFTLIILSIGLFIIMLGGICTVGKLDTLNYYPIIVGYCIFSNVVLEFTIYFFIGATIKFFRRQTIVYFFRSRSILYLRSFSEDENLYNQNELDIINCFAEKERYKLVKVGNPKLLLTKATYIVYYLPTTNWKRHLDKLIKNSEYIYVSLSKTEGLIWEVVSHKEYWHKYIFSLPNIETLNFWIDYCVLHNETEFLSVMLAVKENCTQGLPLVFFINNSKCIVCKNDVKLLLGLRMNILQGLPTMNKA